MLTADRLAMVPKTDFIDRWNRAASVDEVVGAVCARVGRVPRWAVLAWAVALRKKGVELKRFGPAR